MSRYFVRPRANLPLFVEPLWRDESFKPSLDVPDHQATNTGLIDKNGEPIMRAPNTRGFGREIH